MGLRHCCFGSQPTAPIKLATVSWTSLTIFVALKVIILSQVFRKKVYYTRIINTWCCLSGELKRNDDDLGLSYKIRLKTQRNSSPLSRMNTRSPGSTAGKTLHTEVDRVRARATPAPWRGLAAANLARLGFEAAGPGHFWGGVTGDVMRELRAPLSQLISLKCILNIAVNNYFAGSKI